MDDARVKIELLNDIHKLESMLQNKKTIIEAMELQLWNERKKSAELCRVLRDVAWYYTDHEGFDKKLFEDTIVKRIEVLCGNG